MFLKRYTDNEGNEFWWSLGPSARYHVVNGKLEWILNDTTIEDPGGVRAQLAGRDLDWLRSELPGLLERGRDIVRIQPTLVPPYPPSSTVTP